MELDLSSLKSVDKFVAEYKERGLPIHILLNKAAVMAPPFALSVDGIELQFATNHLVSSDLFSRAPSILILIHSGTFPIDNRIT